MTRKCPQHCGRLATAAVFISIGIVQLIAGIILLRSEYVYLLSGPNIWTAVSNIAGGGLLGLSAAIWEQISKSSPKHALRRNILAALVSSMFLLNTTTAIILILGEGNTLLSIQLENSKIGSSANFSSEILAYAYSASVCSPIICIVVAIAFFAEILFPKVRKSFRIRRVLEKDNNTFSWVYKTEHGLPAPDPEVVRKALTSRSSSSSSSDDSTISPVVIRRKLDVESSMATRIGRLESHQDHAVPFEFYREPKRKFSNFSTSRISKSRVSFADDCSANDNILLEAELGDLQDRMKPDIKRRGDLFSLYYDSTLPRDDPNRSVSSKNTSLRQFEEDVQYLTPDVFESFQENLRCRQPLRKTSTTTSLKHYTQDESSHDHSNLYATLSGASSNATGHDLDLFNVSRGDDFIGEVVPIRIDTLPRKKLPPKLVPVAAPVVSSVGCHSLKRVKTSKFKDVPFGGTSSFKGGRGAKHRSKSTGSYPDKHYEAIPHESRKTFSFEAQESSLQLSPAHTSGYMSSGEDNFDLSLRTTTDSFLPNPKSPGCSSSHYAAKRRKFRKRNVQDEELPSKTEAIDDVVKQMIIEKSMLSDETIEELYNMICKRRALLSP